jgi:hypothetical protein
MAIAFYVSYIHEQNRHFIDNIKYNMILNQVRENTFVNKENDKMCY